MDREKTERCGAYAECWKELGKPEGWKGCSLPKGHEGNHQDKELCQALFPPAPEPLREALALELYHQFGGDSWETLPPKRPTGKAHYLSLCKEEFYQQADSIIKLFRDHNFVELAEDQRVPPPIADNYYNVVSEMLTPDSKGERWVKIKP